MPIRKARIEDRNLSRSRCQQAEAALARGDRSAAVEALEEAAQLDPTNEDLPLTAAGLRFEAGEYARAATLALDALAVRPYHPAALNLLGVACLDGGDADLAQQVLRRALAQAPAYEKARDNLRTARRLAKQHAPVERVAELPRERIVALLDRREPTLAVCLLVREPGIGAASLSRDWGAGVDELVIVETAETKSVAGETLAVPNRPATSGDGKSESPGDGPLLHVHHVVWNDDYAAARNEALRHARSDWILMVDSDERLDDESWRAVHEAIGDAAALGHALTVTFACGTSCREVRLFRNASGARFTGRVFAQVHSSLRLLERQWGLGLRPVEAGVRRDGPAPTEGVWREHRELIEQALDSDTAGPLGALSLRLKSARLALETGRVEQALAALREIHGTVGASDEKLGPPEREELATLEGRCLMQLERFADLDEAMRRHHAAHEPSHNTRFLEAVAARATGQPARAIEMFADALARLRRPFWCLPVAPLRGAGVHVLIGAAHIDLGELDAAETAFRRALDCEESNLEARLGLLGVRVARDQIEELIEDLAALCSEHGDRPQAWSFGGAVLAQLPPLAPSALEWMEEACRRFPRDAEIVRLLAEARLRSGKVDEALALWESRAPDDPAGLAARVAASLASGRELPALPAHRLDSIGERVLAWFRSWMACQSWPALDRALVDIDRVERRLPGLAARTAAWLDEVGQDEAAARIRDRIGGQERP